MSDRCRWSLAFAVAMVMVMAMAVGPLSAQDRARPPEFTLGGLVSSAQELIPPTATLVEELAAADIDRLSGVEFEDVGPFNERRYGFWSVRVYFDRTPSDPDARTLSFLEPPSTLALALELRRRAQPSRWFAISFPPGPRTDLSEVESEPTLAVTLATPDRRLPVLDVQWSSSSAGQRASEARLHHLLVDLREHPRVLGVFDHVESEQSGSCPIVEREASGFACRWQGRDFLCDETRYLPIPRWTSKRGSRRFWLGSGSPVPMTRRSAYAHPLDLIGTKPDARTHVIEGAGQARVIQTTSTPHGVLQLVGAPSLTEDFGVSLFAGVARGSRRVIGTRVAIKHLGSDRDALINAASDVHTLYTPDGLDIPRFNVKVVAQSGDLTVLQLTVREGAGRGVFLVGLELTDRGFTADAVRVATDATNFGDCGSTFFPRTATAMMVTSVPFSARLDIEPANEIPWQGELEVVRAEGESRCAVQAELTWKMGLGFAMESSVTACQEPARPRLVQIDDEGSLRARP